MILEAGQGTIVDHINGDIRDNRRANLRFATHSESMCNRGMAKNNRSGFKGVSVDKRKCQWRYRATIKCEGKKYNLGTFATPEEAYEAYKKASQELHGQFARVL